ncbi:MAG: hypothetical protein QOI66_5191 [Myxococcales bacterium]|nr:hypothetical protein [Myxococcales bacterium]
MAALLLVVVGSSGCRHRTNDAASTPPPPPPPALGAVSIRDLTTPEGAAVTVAVDPGGVEHALATRLLASGIVIDRPASSPEAGQGAPGAVLRLRGEFALDGAEVPGKALARAVVRLQLDTRPSDAPGAIAEQLQGQGEQTYAVPKGAARDAVAALRRDVFTKLVQRIAGDLLEGVIARRKLESAPPETIHAALTADAGELREEAIRMAGQRQLRGEVPRLLELLTDDDEATRDAALGALIALKDARAVATLTKSRSLRDRREMRKIIEAISVLGGEEALDYLSFVAETHDDEEIRTQAAQARQRLLRRTDGGAAQRP